MQTLYDLRIGKSPLDAEILVIDEKERIAVALGFAIRHATTAQNTRRTGNCKVTEDEIKVVAELLAKIGGNWYPERADSSSRPIGNRHRDVARLIIGAVERARAPRRNATDTDIASDMSLDGQGADATEAAELRVGDTVMYLPPGDKRTIACRIEKMEDGRAYVVPDQREVGWVSTHTLLPLKQPQQTREVTARPRISSPGSSADSTSSQQDTAEILTLASYSQVRVGEASGNAKYYFNSFGDWLAYRRFPNDRYLFNRKGQWIGWLPWNDNEVVDVNGQYLGTLVDGDRLLRKSSRDPHRREAGFIVHPGSGGYPGSPGAAPHFPLPFGFKDIDPSQIPTGHRSWLKNGAGYGMAGNQSAFVAWMSKIGLGQFASWIESKITSR